MIEIRHQELRQGDTVRAAYDRLYAHRDLRMRDSFYLWLLELLDPQPGGILVDISCGEGRLLHFAARAGVQAIGVDLSLRGLMKARRDSDSQVQWIVGDGQQLPLPTACADYVAHIGSLEHYVHPLQGAQEIARILKPTGRACILLPNAFGLWGNIRHVWRTGDVFDDGQPLQRYATLRVWQTLLHQGGLAIETTIGWGEVNLPRTRADLLWMARRPLRWIRGILTRWIPLPLQNHFVFLCRPMLSSPSGALPPTLPWWIQAGDGD